MMTEKEATDSVRSGVVMAALSNSKHTVDEIHSNTGMEKALIADLARHLVRVGMAREPSPGCWRLTRVGWDRVHTIEENKKLEREARRAARNE